MPSHSDRVQAARDRVVECAKAEFAYLNTLDAAYSQRPRPEEGHMEALEKVASASQLSTYAHVRALLALEAQTCGECNGRGIALVFVPHEVTRGPGAPRTRYDRGGVSCPACSGTGAKREVEK